MTTLQAATDLALDHPGALKSCTTIIAEIDEPLRQSAPINFAAAHRLCRTHADGFNCTSYHALWQYLRLANVTPAVRADGPLFVDAARRFARAGQMERVLICGSADYSMLAHLAHGAASAGGTPQFDVLDLCETTLNINAWYGRERNVQVRALHGDVHGFTPDVPYDLICTHSFLPWHPVEDRPALFRRWRDWLKPGGHLCFSNRISPAMVPFDPRERAERIDRMTRKALQKLERIDMPLPCASSEFIALMQKFGERRRQDYPELPLAGLRGLIEQAGLVINIAVDAAETLRNREDTTVLSGGHQGRPRMWFQARRP